MSGDGLTQNAEKHDFEVPVYLVVSSFVDSRPFALRAFLDLGNEV